MKPASLLLTGDIWLTVLVFGRPLQPVLLEVDSPKRYLSYIEESPARQNRFPTLDAQQKAMGKALD